jgi:Domain of unknown function (DUF5060)/Domain of unknown function (DUF5605)/Protein of unknown function (DUF4038)
MKPFPSLLLGLVLAAGPAVAAPPSALPTVERWGIYEITLRGPSAGNPFVDVRLSAVFTDGEQTFNVAGFYDGDGIYRIRFMPDRTGVWRYQTQSNRWPLTGRRGAFEVTPATGDDHGPVRVAHTYHFAYADGTPYWELGTTCYSWTYATPDWRARTLKTLAASPFNKVRMLVFPQEGEFRGKPPTLFPYDGTPPRGWDFDRPNPAFFRHFEQCVGQLRDLGIQADIVLFHPYGKRWGFSSMSPAEDALYLRYIVARLAAYRNVWWSMANEYDFVRTKTEPEWDRIFQIVERADPYGHLRSIHNGALIYNDTLPWVTHASIQNGSAVEDPGRAELYRDVYRKPIVYDEVKYEGNIDARWGQLTPQQMVFRFWNATVAGTYAGHGECYKGYPEGTWISFGGVLRGRSEPRLAFLKRILETAPAAGIDPIDKWQDSPMGGQPGEYYLAYFGRARPTSWKFELYKSGLADGMRFHVDVLDTWNMTVAPVPGTFVLKRENPYYFVDEGGRSVPLPGRPYLALRIRRVGGPAPAPDPPPGG